MFVENLESDIKKIYNRFKFPKKVNRTMKDQINYANATHCDICQDELGEDKVLDYCHLTGKYRGAAHNECNLQYKSQSFSQSSFITYQAMTAIYLSRTLVHQKVR